MVWIVAVHGTHHTQIIRQRTQMRYQLGKFNPRLAARLKAKLASHQGFSLQAIVIATSDLGGLLAMPLL